jgi:phospholipase C
VVIAYDDSDGWYDHQMSPIVNQSREANDALTGPGACGTNPARIAGGYLDRCGYGPRQPLLVISPFAKRNFVDHSVTDQTSILRFIEDNWNTGRVGNYSFDEKAGSLTNLFTFRTPGDDGHGARAPRLTLDPETGQPKAL